MSELNFQELRKFIAEEAGVDENEVTLEARLYDDLGVYGDDATELLINYGKKFNVNVSRFMAADYFKAEGGTNFIDGVIRLFTGKIPASGLKTLTVHHLEKGILAGKLDEEVINR